MLIFETKVGIINIDLLCFTQQSTEETIIFLEELCKPPDLLLKGGIHMAAFNYPEDFLNRAKELYPDYHKLHMAIEAGSASVGRYLLENQDGSEEKKNLYEDWENIFEFQRFHSRIFG